MFGRRLEAQVAQVINKSLMRGNGALITLKNTAHRENCMGQFLYTTEALMHDVRWAQITLTHKARRTLHGKTLSCTVFESLNGT